MKPDPYGFVMSFIAASDEYKQPYVERWKEVLANFMVEPTWESQPRNSVNSPYRRTGTVSTRSLMDQILLVDPETHKAIMTYASKLVKALFDEKDAGYVQTRPRGEEDALQKSPTVNRLLRYTFQIPGHFRTFVEAVIDMLLFGTSVIEVGWEYCEREIPVRTVTSELGIETDSFQRLAIPVYDDVKMRVVDIVDFYPDPGKPRMQDMRGAAKRFKMDALEARYMAKKGIYDSAKVEQAIQASGKAGSAAAFKNDFRQGIDRQSESRDPDAFRTMIGYEYRGEVDPDQEYETARREIVILNNVVVKDDAWSLADPELPWKTLIINPLQGRFYGVGPGEVMRWDQDFASSLKMLLARAIIRQVYPPIAYDPDGFDGNLSAVKKWGDADEPIPIRGGPAGIGALQYNANVRDAMGLLGSLQASMQGTGGAPGAIQGEPGPDREAASVGMQRFEFAMEQPELAGMVLERECLPPIGLAILRRCQQFIPDTDALKRRIGELPDPGWIGDIMGEFDVAFVGSRLVISKQLKLQTVDRLVALSSAIPPLMMQLPWQDLGRWIVGDLMELPEISAKMQDPRNVMLNAMLSQIAGPGGPANNGVAQTSQPAGMLPAQAAGGPAVG